MLYELLAQAIFSVLIKWKHWLTKLCNDFLKNDFGIILLYCSHSNNTKHMVVLVNFSSLIWYFYYLKLPLRARFLTTTCTTNQIRICSVGNVYAYWEGSILSGKHNQKECIYIITIEFGSAHKVWMQHVECSNPQKHTLEF